MLDNAGAKDGRALDEFEAKALLKEHGVDVVDECRVTGQDEACQAARTLGFPVVLKGCSSKILHKTEAGIVAVGLQDEAQLCQAFQTISSRASDLEGYLVQKMIPGKREFLVGMARDPVFGPCVAFGLGGIFTEALRDVTYRIAPFDAQEAAVMCQEIRGKRLLGAFRGEGPVHIGALAGLLKAVGDLAKARPDIAEIDLNPVMPFADRVVAVDAVIVFK